MMNKHIIFALSAGLLFSCSEPQKSDHQKEQQVMNNPFFQEYDTPFGVPPFDSIRNEHFKPALLRGIEEKRAEVRRIIENTDEPNFENTIEALESTGALLDKVSAVFYNLNSAHTNKEIQNTAKEIAPELSALDDDIYLNDTLFQKVNAVRKQKSKLDLTDIQLKLLEDTHKKFKRSGAHLDKKQKSRLRKINGELSVLSLEFGQNVLAATNDYELVIEDSSDLSGLPQSLINNAKEEAEERDLEGKWVFTLHNPSLLPFLENADNRELRKEIWEAYRTRCIGGERDNRPIIKKLVSLRAEKADLLGYEHHTEYVLEQRMAKEKKNVYELLDQIWKPALAKAHEEADDIRNVIKEEGGDFELQPYDWRYYTEKIRAELYDLDDSEVKLYFSLNSIRDGIFNLTNKLWGLNFKELDDIPVYHEDVTAYKVLDKDDTHLGVLYMDFHPRSSKRGGAWMTSYRTQSVENGKRKAPVISIVCNFSKPSQNKPALLTFDEVTTYFHEFGHALHGLLSDVPYKSLAGTNVPTDFVELPSQIMENWAEDPKYMNRYAVHYETGDTIPEELVSKLKESATFNQGFATTEYMAASYLDLAYHSLKEPFDGDVEEFEKEAMNEIGLPDEILPRYRSTYFNHVFAGGYSAGYYSYIWSGVLDADAYEVFKKDGLFNQEHASAFREKILERGGTRDAMEMYKDFRGSEPSIEPLLRKRGLDRPSFKDKEKK